MDAGSGEGHGLNLFLKNSMSMLKYHSGLVDTLLSIFMVEWPIMVKPMAFTLAVI